MVSIFQTAILLSCTFVNFTLFITKLINMYSDSRGRNCSPNMYHYSYLTCTMTEAGSLPTTPCYLTCTMITEADSSSHLTIYIYQNNRGRPSAHHTLLPNMYHDRGRLSAHHTLQPNMYHDNIGRLYAHLTLLPNSNMYPNNRGRLSAHHTLLPNMYHDNRGRHSTYCTLLSNGHHDYIYLLYFSALSSHLDKIKIFRMPDPERKDDSQESTETQKRKK